jgi:DamX protein
MKFSHRINIQRLQEQLESMRQTGINPILFIDDIELLDKSLIPTLSLLIQHTTETQPALRLVVSGQDLPPEFEKIIPKDDDKTSLKYIPLPPLTEIETTEYIKHRLHASNYQYLEPFNKKQIKKIYLEAKGFPNLINQLADQVFTQYTIDYDIKKPKLNFPEKTITRLKYIASGLSVLILIFVLYLLFDSSKTENEIGSVQTNTQELEIPTIVATNQTPEIETEEKTDPLPIKKEINTIDTKKTQALKAIVKPEPSKQKETIKETTIDKKTIKAEKQKTLTAKPKTVVKKPKPAQKPKPKAKPATPKKVKSSIKDTDWIKQQNPKHYTLQLIGGANHEATKRFIKKHKITNNATIFRSFRKGKYWYSVIYGSYKTLALAKKASKKLPKSLKNIKPWPRSFRAIQKSLK